MSVRHTLAAVGTAALLGGCGVAGRLSVEPVAVAAQKPGNVAAYVAVSQHGAGVAGLDQHNFRVYEDGVRLDNARVQLSLLPITSAASHHAAVLVDTSHALDADQRAASVLS